MNLPHLIRTRWLSQSCRKTKALWLRTFGFEGDEVMQAPPFTFLFLLKGYRALPVCLVPMLWQSQDCLDMGRGTKLPGFLSMGFEVPTCAPTDRRSGDRTLNGPVAQLVRAHA